MSSPLVQARRWHEHATAAALQAAVADEILRVATDSIAARGAFHVVLSGGNTPRAVYARLRTATTQWAAWHIYFGDERCLPADHPERNSRMAHEAWLAHVAIPEGQIHIIPAERGADEAATAYAATLANVEAFDLVLLGLGEDGHTASLFPGISVADASVVAVESAPKPPPRRVSLSAARLSAARHVLFLVSGTGKRGAVAAWRRGAALPAAAIVPAGGVDIHLDFAVDSAAPERT